MCLDEYYPVVGKCFKEFNVKDELDYDIAIFLYSFRRPVYCYSRVLQASL